VRVRNCSITLEMLTKPPKSRSCPIFLRQPFNTAFGKQLSSFVGDLKFLRSADFSAAMGRMGLWRDGGRFGSTSVFNPAGSCVGASRLPCWSPAGSAIAGLGDWAASVGNFGVAEDQAGIGFADSISESQREKR